MNFLKNILSTLVALVIFSILALLAVVYSIGLIMEEPPVEVKSNSILHLKLNRPVSEIEFDNQLESFGWFGSKRSTIGLVQLKEAILHAKTDDKISGIYLDAPNVKAGMAIIQELRSTLADFKKSGKFIVAFGEFYTEPSYFLASVADQVYLHPEGDLEFNGLGANVTFFQGLFEKLGIEPQIFRVGDYKSAVEPFIRKDLSAENKEQITDLLNSIYNNILDSISLSRGIPLSELKNVSFEMLVRNPQDARQNRLIDSLYYLDQVMTSLKRRTGIEEELALIPYDEYNKSYSTYKKTADEVAVIVAEGEIVSGKGNVNSIGSEKFLEEIQKVREDEDVKAVVIRINSPGGSFLASDVMWREIRETSRIKPVIASMSSVAASGGYYMAMACDTIVAQPTTITGSIGIFGMLFNAKGFLNNKLGITHDEVTTGKYSNLITVTRPLTDQEKRIIQTDIEQGYETFVTKAAQGRQMTVESIKAVAGGRVWTGLEAKENGLVDIIGDLEDAVKLAAEKAKVSTYKIKYYPKEDSFLERFFEGFEEDSEARILQRELGEYYPYIQHIKRIHRLNGPQAVWPFELEIN